MFTNFLSQIFPWEVSSGDTFFNLAKKFNTSVEEICAANPQVNPHSIEVGQKIYIPINRPSALAKIRGGPIRPEIRGTVFFYEVPDGTWVCVAVEGLPPYSPATGGQAPIGPHGFHIHEYGSCEIGDPQNPFQAAGGHWNPANQPHGNHAGDFPVLFSNRGYARMCFFTDKFRPIEIIGRSVMIHLNPDDYRTQPAGDSGKRLACGVIEKA